jgi:hypothetical protein
VAAGTQPAQQRQQEVAQREIGVGDLQDFQARAPRAGEPYTRLRDCGKRDVPTMF